MHKNIKTSLWGAASIVLIGALLFAQAAFANNVVATDESAGDAGAGVIMLSSAIVLAALFVVTTTLFLKNLTSILRERRDATQ